MNLGDLIEEFRIETDDNAEGNIFSENEVRVWLNQAHKEACRRAHLLVDTSTASTCLINAVAGTAEYSLSSKTIFVKRITIPSLRNKVLRPIKAELMDNFLPNWESKTGEPRCYVVGLNSRKIQLFPSPVTNMDLKLTVVRLPIVDMEAPSDVPEIEEEYHQGLVQWALYRGYSKKDYEAEDTDMAAAALRRFEEEFGTRVDANAAIEQFLLEQTYQFNSGMN